MEGLLKHRFLGGLPSPGSHYIGLSEISSLVFLEQVPTLMLDYASRTLVDRMRVGDPTTYGMQSVTPLQ